MGLFKLVQQNWQVCVSVLVFAVPEEAQRAKCCQTLVLIEGVRAGVRAIIIIVWWNPSEERPEKYILSLTDTCSWSTWSQRTKLPTYYNWFYKVMSLAKSQNPFIMAYKLSITKLLPTKKSILWCCYSRRNMEQRFILGTFDAWVAGGWRVISRVTVGPRARASLQMYTRPSICLHATATQSLLSMVTATCIIYTSRF